MVGSCINLGSIKFSKDVLDVLEINQELIVKQWLIYPTLFDILNKFNISHEYYENNVASPVLNYFISIVRGENEPGDCPVMRKVVDLFYEKGFNVEDVFLSCTAFKNVLNKLLVLNEIEENMISNLIMILDMNLSNILAIYTQKLKDREELIELHSKLIEEHVLMSITDPKGMITYVTDAFCDLSGFSREELIGKTHSVITNPEGDESFYKNIWEKITTGKEWSGTITNVKKNGDKFILKTSIIPVKDKNGEILEYMAIRENVTDRELFQYDQLTSAYTRRIFEEKFESILKEKDNKNFKLSMVIADIDHFKRVNDNYGHQKGDEILKEFTSIILENIRADDMCFRWGGEEFVILLPYAELSIANRVAERIRKDFLDKAVIEGVHQSASFGVTEYKKTDNKETMVQRADNALYKAKQTGRNRVEVDWNGM